MFAHSLRLALPSTTIPAVAQPAHQRRVAGRVRLRRPAPASRPSWAGRRCRRCPSPAPGGRAAARGDRPSRASSSRCRACSSAASLRRAHRGHQPVHLVDAGPSACSTCSAELVASSPGDPGTRSKAGGVGILTMHGAAGSPYCSGMTAGDSSHGRCTRRGRREPHRVRPADRAGLRARGAGGLRPGDPARRAGRVPVHPRRLPDDVHRPAVDDAAVRRVRHRRGVQRALPAAARARHRRAVGRLRPADPDGLRLRRPDRARRGRQGRRGDRLDRRHADAVRRHPARPGLDVDDDQRARPRCCCCSTSSSPRSRASPRGQLTGTIQNDVLKEYIARGTYIYPPKPSLRLITDIFAYCRAEMPRWNTISISGYHMAEAGATPAQEIAFTLADGIEYVRAAIDAGLDVDDFAPRLSFFFVARTTLLEEVAKFRAARRIWARVMRDEFGAQEPEVADAALPHPDRRRAAHRAAARGQPGPGRGAGRSARCSAAPSRCTPTPSTRRSRCPPRRRPGWRCAPSRCSPTRPT